MKARPSQQLMQIPVDGCLPAPGADLAEICFSPWAMLHVLERPFTPCWLITAEVAGEQNQAPQLLWVGEQLQHEPQEDEGSTRWELIPLHLTSQGSSTSQPKTRKFPKAGYILPGLGPELPPYLNHPQPAWGIAGLTAACQHCSICSQISVFQEKLFVLCFPQDNGVKV